jgi:hypothetical protein
MIVVVLYILGVMFQYVNVHRNHKKLVNSRGELDIFPWYQVAIATSWFGFGFLLIKSFLDRKFINKQ